MKRKRRRLGLRLVRREILEAGLSLTTVVGHRRRARRSRRPRRGRRLIVDVPGLPPQRIGGSERSIAGVATGLAQHGFEVTVLDRTASSDTRWEGLERYRATFLTRLRLYPRSDAVLTQLSARPAAMFHARLAGVPLVHFLRNGPLDPVGTFGAADLLVFNAEWLRAGHLGPERTMTLPPPIDSAEYVVDASQGDRVVQVNLSWRKGGDLFFELARRMPHRRFLGVRSDYDTSVAPQVVPHNVELIDPQQDMRNVYRRARVLLMPSRVEPYGRVGVEAAVSGIPVIATPLPGICEALDPAGIFLPREDIDGWIAAIDRLCDPEPHRRESQRSRDLRHRLPPPAEGLNSLIEELDAIRWRPRRRTRPRASEASPSIRGRER